MLAAGGNDAGHDQNLTCSAPVAQMLASCRINGPIVVIAQAAPLTPHRASRDCQPAWTCSWFESVRDGQILAMSVTEQKFAISPAALFDVLVDPTTYPKWLVGAKHIREISPDWPAPESWFKHTVGFGPLAIPDRTTLRDVEAPIMLELLVRARPAIEAVVRFDVVPKADGCLLRMTETPAGLYKFVSPLAQPLIRARNERSLRRLRDLVDQLPRTSASTSPR